MSMETDFKHVVDAFNTIAETYPKETRQFLNKEKAKLRRRLNKSAETKVNKSDVDKIDGEEKKKYHGSFKGGRVWMDADGMMVRVYSSAPHAHLVEYGHRLIGPDGEENGFVKGKFVFRDEQAEFEPIFKKDAEEYIDQMLRRFL